jgi:exodeoxyribonuclease VII large subunit
VVSAIGHEQDSPLLDYVADVRASTPTDAAKRIVPDVGEEQRRIAELRARLRQSLTSRP